MKTLIVAGSPWCPLRPVLNTLVQAGCGHARSATAGSIASLPEWHERLFAGQSGATTGAIQPGKAWELAASELFLANWAQPAWAWADHRSTWLLDFWLAFDPHTCFVLLHTPAPTVLAQALSDNTLPRFNSQALLTQWSSYQAELLRFYHRNRTRCVFLQSDAALAHPGSFIQSLNTQFGTQLAPAACAPLAAPAPALLNQLLVERLVQEHPQAHALQQEITATLPELQPGAAAAPPSTEALAQELRALYLHQAEAAIAAQQLQENLSLALEEYNAVTTETIANLETELAQLQATCEAEALAKAQALALRDIQAKQHVIALQAQTQENELLLLQLCQAQDELAKYFLKAQELQSQLTTAEQTHATQANQEAKAANEQLANQALALEKQSADASNSIASLHAELAALQAAKQALMANNAALAAAKDSEAQARDAQAQAMAQAVAERDAQAQQHASTLQNQTQENERLLLQLHQVQEELEHYFLQHQKAQQDKQQIENRLTALLVRYPDYCEWDRVEAVPEQTHRWQIHGFKSGGRTIPFLDLALAHPGHSAKGAPVLVLAPPAPGSPSPLLYWPTPADETASDATASTPQALHLQPGAKPHAKGPATAAAQTLRSLAPADLQFLQAACGAASQWLPSSEPNRTATAEQLQTLHTQLQHLAPTWRYDTVRLKHSQVNPDYEHLWFSLTNARFGERHWPIFEFRLSASNVKRGKFSTLPKLEFPLPEHDDKQFENWVEESEDDRGPKFELRFDLKTTAMDVAAWQTLSPTDQAQALSMAAHLPELLVRLQQSGATIKRPWADWQGFATGIQRTLRQCLALPETAFASA